ncbi:FxLYD domain-containing protein [Streptomyces sp. ME02-6991-2B]|nr:FxLYD domain-containing protein [Streptomyces sp. ME19-03-3]MDX3214413.1 FxLYD domain-containing protein [Streptomyces sp. ME02-6991-2B]
MSQQSHASPPGQYAPLQEQDRSRPPKKSGAGKLLVFGAVAIVVIGAGVAFALNRGEGEGGSGGDTSAATESPAGGVGQKGDLADAKITSCGLNDFSKWPNAEVTITNHSSQTSDYQVRIEFLDTGGQRLAQTVANATGLAAGDAVETSAQGSEALSGKITCKVTEVWRKAG